jgi:NAD-dependent deacetylase
MSNDALSQLIRDHRRILLFTGAGISTGSGIPDFRGPDGVWKTRRPVYYQDFMTSESARIEHWDYKLEGWEGFRQAKPNAAHHAIARLENAGKMELLVTQNIDGLHTEAGTTSARLVEVHGTNRLVECQSCGKLTDPQPHFDFFREHRTPPVCDCGGLLKPATISFGQPLREDDMRRAASAAGDADLVIALGTTLSVNPAATIPLLAAERGVPYVIINRGETDHDDLSCVTLRLEGDVVELFPPAVDVALEQ